MYGRNPVVLGRCPRLICDAPLALRTDWENMPQQLETAAEYSDFWSEEDLYDLVVFSLNQLN